MIDSEENPRMIQAHQALLQRLGRVLGNGRQPLTKPLLDRMYEVVKDHRAHWRNEGVDFPVLVALVVPRCGIVEWARADLDASLLQTKIINFVRLNPSARMEEVVVAFRAAYPDLKPDVILGGQQQAKAAQERAIERAERHVEEAQKEKSDEN